MRSGKWRIYDLQRPNDSANGWRLCRLLNWYADQQTIGSPQVFACAQCDAQDADGDLPPACRTKVMEQSPLISENSGYETIQIYR